MILQSLFAIYSMLYAWNREDTISSNLAPTQYSIPHKSFTLLLPAYKEEAVIETTIRNLASIRYPEQLNQILVLLRPQDEGTVRIAQNTINTLSNKNIRIILVDSNIINKPNQLNAGLIESKGEYIGIIDAEDNVSLDILNITNTVLVKNNYNVVQHGVQLVNVYSKWFSRLNSLEYFFWFKSAMQLYVDKGVYPMAGNSVFMKRDLMNRIKGWDETCLTEDCDMGVRLANYNLKVKIINDPKHTTLEQTPLSISSFVHQRTRWNQGFIQIFNKLNWMSYPKLESKLMALYILIWPLLQPILSIFSIVSVFLFLSFDVGLPITMVLVYPLFLLVIQIFFLNVGFYQLARDYKIKYSYLSPFVIILTYFPYQLLLTISSVRAVYREIFNINNWEKTAHFNLKTSKNKSTQSSTSSQKLFK
jgi:glycosyltransferase XagB